MTADEQPASAPALITAGGVFLPGEVCAPLWRILRVELDRHIRQGGRVRPEIGAARDVLRAGALAYLSANGHADTQVADIPAPSEDQATRTGDLVSTAELAARMGVSERHARRLAALHGVAPAARGVWTQDDAAELVASRTRRHH